MKLGINITRNFVIYAGHILFLYFYVKIHGSLSRSHLLNLSLSHTQTQTCNKYHNHTDMLRVRIFGPLARAYPKVFGLSR